MLFTDIEGSTLLLQRVGRQRFVGLLDEHHRIMRDSIERHEGEEIQNEGDAFVVLFRAAENAVNAAVDAQRALRRGPWPVDAEISVRMGVHTGEIGISASGHHGLPLHEAARVADAAHGGQILVSAAARQRIEASDRTTDIGFRELGLFALKDFGERVPLIQVVHVDLAKDFPPPRTTGSTRHNLPAQLTSLVGRDVDAAEVERLIDGHRLVTLLGSGGVGKTRLALQVAARTAPRFRGGVWFVELSSIADGSKVSAEIRRSVGILDEDDSVLLEALGRKPALLVLDNCEHVLGDVAEVVRKVTRACPELHVVATSREPVGVVGESQWRVPSLELSDSIELFITRAQLVAPDLVITPEDRRILERVCDRLDGIPLAIELAAARMGKMSIEEVESRLLDQFRMLNTGGSGRVARHQTLKAALEWSYRLLSAGEQQLFRRLAVFRGSPEIPAVEAVAGGAPLDQLDVAELVDSLHDKSLVTIDPTNRPARVHLSEIVRQFAMTLLVETDELPLLSERHARHFLAFSHEAFLGVRGAGRIRWLDRIAADRENLSSAFGSLLSSDPEAAAVLIANMKEWFVTSSDSGWLEQLRAMSDRDDLPPRAIAMTNALRALLAGGHGREPAALAERAARRAGQHLDAVSDPYERVRVLTNAALGFREADPTMAAELSRRAVDEAGLLNDDVEMASSLLDLIFVHHEHHPETQRLRTKTLELMEGLGDQWSNANPLIDEALATHQMGHHDDSLARLAAAERMLARSQRSHVISEDARVWASWSVLIRAEVGDTATAIMIAEDTLARVGDAESLATKSLNGSYGQALLLSGRGEDARGPFEIALDQTDAWRYISGAIALIGLGLLDIGAGDHVRTIEQLTPVAENNRRDWVRARAHDVIARAHLDMGAQMTARDHVREADRLRAANGFVVPPRLEPEWSEVRDRLGMLSTQTQ